MYGDLPSSATFEADRISPSRRPCGLTDLDIACFVVGLASLKGHWGADRYEGSEGDSFLLLGPRRSDDEALSFSAHRDATGLRLTAWRGDTHEALGSFPRAQDALGCIWKLVEAEHAAASVSDPETFRRAYQIIARAGEASAN